ncbi:MAG: hypothetical protein Q4F07_06790 [Bacteroidales bacterium]|nr:hypothetical protein [Bacteroidales bacterium]
MLGIGVGCIGLSLDDFCNCDYDEFESICRSWSEMTEGQTREAWERARMIATICIQPHLRKRISPQKLLPFPWDKKKAEIKRQNSELTPEQRRRRFEELVHRLGDETIK